MLKLPDVTLVTIETRQHELARIAVRDCLDKVEFGEVLNFTDREHMARFQTFGRTIEVPDWPEKEGWSRFTWQGMVQHIRTAFALCIQWDSWVVDPSAWRDEFMDYDYIGAPWWYTDGKNVGNGGFCLRSHRLMHHLRKHRDRFPCTNSLDDDLLCRKYRPQLMSEGLTWAPEWLAREFSFECVKYDCKSFGFHAMHNWGYVLDRERLIERAKIASQSEYITKNSWMWAKLNERNPWLADALKENGQVQIGAVENG